MADPEELINRSLYVLKTIDYGVAIDGGRVVQGNAVAYLRGNQKARVEYVLKIPLPCRVSVKRKKGVSIRLGLVDS